MSLSPDPWSYQAGRVQKSQRPAPRYRQDQHPYRSLGTARRKRDRRRRTEKLHPYAPKCFSDQEKRFGAAGKPRRRAETPLMHIGEGVLSVLFLV